MGVLSVLAFLWRWWRLGGSQNLLKSHDLFGEEMFWGVDRCVLDGHSAAATDHGD
jgi:hypothetical protein